MLERWNSVWNNQRYRNIAAPTWNIHRPSQNVGDELTIAHAPPVFPPTVHADPSVGVTLEIPLASYREKELIIDNYKTYMAGCVKRGRLKLEDGMFDIAEAMYDISPFGKDSRALGVKEFCCKSTGPFLNDLQEYVGDPAPTDVAQAQNSIMFRLITHPAFADAENIRKITEIEQRKFNRVDGTTDRPLLDVFLPAHSFLWA